MNRLLDKYKSEVVPALTQKFNFSNIMQVPKLVKVVINIACGDAVGNSKAIDTAVFFLYYAGKILGGGKNGFYRFCEKRI